jgi:hypothetical protein
MKDHHAELMSRVEKKKRELELAVEKSKGDHPGVTIEDADLIKKNLNYLKEILQNGVQDLSAETVRQLEEWLPQG